MRRWRNTNLVDPRDLSDDWVADFAQHGSRYAPQEWLDECYHEWYRRDCPGREPLPWDEVEPVLRP